MGVVTASGGANDIIADRAADEGIEIPRHHADARRADRRVLPSFAAIRNPLDVTGFDAGRPGQGGRRRRRGGRLNAVVDDPGVDFILNAVALPVDQPPDPTRDPDRRLAGGPRPRHRTDKPIVHFTLHL